MSCRATRRASPLQAAGALLLALSILTACGKKGDPLPPLRNIPMPTKDLQIRQQGAFILLDMGYPSTTVSGMALGGVDAVELLELVKPAPLGDDPPEVSAAELAATAETLLTLSGAELNSAVTGERIGIRLPIAEEPPEEPRVSIFAVRTRKGDEVSEISNRVMLIPVEPPAPPRELTVTPRALSIELAWEIEGEVAGFDVLRREAQVRGYGKPLKRVPGDRRQFFDRTASYGKRYIYTVRTVLSEDPLIQSAEAGEREVEYADRFAPPVPKNFVALAERASVRLRWDPSPHPDVAGYILYRREPGRDFHRLNEEPIQGTEYLDRGLASGLTYAYRIQVIDKVGNESGRSRPVSTTTR